MKNEHGHCPKCNANLDGGSIWEHFLKETGNAEEADQLAAFYGANREKGQWGRQIGVYDQSRDIVVAWKCPDCQHEWVDSKMENTDAFF